MHLRGRRACFLRLPAGQMSFLHPSPSALSMCPKSPSLHFSLTSKGFLCFWHTRGHLHKCVHVLYVLVQEALQLTNGLFANNSVHAQKPSAKYCFCSRALRWVMIRGQITGWRTEEWLRHCVHKYSYSWIIAFFWSHTPD